MSTFLPSFAPGSTAEAVVHNILTKTDGIWQYNGLTDGVNGVIVETSTPGAITLAGAEPGLTHGAVIDTAAIYLNNVTATNFSDNNIYDNDNGIVFAGTSDANTVTDDVISSFGSDIKQLSSGANILNNASFNLASTTVSSGELNIYYRVRARITNPVSSIYVYLNNIDLGLTNDSGYTGYTSINPYNLDSTGYINVLNPYTLRTYNNSGYFDNTSYPIINIPNQTLTITLVPRLGASSSYIPSGNIICQSNFLIKYPSSPKVYFLENCFKRWITDEYSFNQAHYDWGNIQTTTTDYLDGPDITIAPSPVISPVIITTTTTPVPLYIFKNLLKLGMRGEEIKQLQLRLQQLNYFTYPTITGYFGNVTALAVKKFQKDHDLSSVGYVGPGTRKALNNY
jgi:hypothetical protein